jgi:riboflavin kinase/FMN adenylyltransferase
LSGSVVTIGAFDGVHRGHQALIREATRRAKEIDHASVVYTFDPPPRKYFENARVLTPLPEKLRKVESLGVDYVVVAGFDDACANRTASSFIGELALLNPEEVLAGPNFRFGRGREGGLSTLAENFRTRTLEPLKCHAGKPVSSSRVRALLAEGDADAASKLLGWNFGETGAAQPAPAASELNGRRGREVHPPAFSDWSVLRPRATPNRYHADTAAPDARL